MTLRTMFFYLIGSQRAILEIANRRSWLWVGLAWVVSAGVAREYDGEDLWHEPWHLLIPLGASLVSSFVLFSLVFAVARRRGAGEGSFWGLYRSFLSLYWMTAPLAWLYAIPVERLLSPADATAANLWLLAIVSVWRVALMVRVLVVWFDAHPGAALWLVMFFADTLMLTILYFTPLPIFPIMGGVRLSQSEQVLQATAFFVGFLGTITWPIWLIGIISILANRRPGWRLEQPNAVNSDASRMGVWALTACSLAVWTLILPVTQREQQLRWRTERLLRRGEIAQAVELMASHRADEFPPHWDPPPRLAYRETRPPLLDVVEAVIDSSAPPWIMERYQEKLIDSFEQFRYWYVRYSSDEMAIELERHVAVLERLPNREGTIADNRETLNDLGRDERIAEPLRSRIQALLGASPSGVEDE